MISTLVNRFISPSKVRGQQRVRILEKIREVDTATCCELERLLKICHQAASARISELKKQNRIEETGEMRLTQYGRPAHVYRIKEK